MRILLVGEFSGVHRNLMEQLNKDGHQCDLLSDGDGWKGFSSTISIPKRNPIKGARKLLFPLLDFLGIAGFSSYFENRKILDKIDNYDVIQFVNPQAIKAFGALGNILLFKRLLRKAPKVFLCALGGDLCVETFYLSKKLKYSPWTTFNYKSFPYFYQNVSFFFPLHVVLHCYVTNKVVKIIPGLYEYKCAYEKNKKCTSIIELPINCEEYQYNGFSSLENKAKVKIFYSKKPHAGDFYKKGYGFFNDALGILDKKGVEYDLVTASGIPFIEYQKLLLDCDVLLDQTLSYDRGMSGVIGMANGMITFSGNEPEIEDYYKRKIPCINAEPNAVKLAEKLIDVINNYNDYIQLKIDSKHYIKKYHSAEVITSKYIEVWTKE